MRVGVILGDVSTSVSPKDHLDSMLRQIESAQRNGVTMFVMGHHYLYGNLRWLQPIPTLARLSVEMEPHVRMATMTVQAPLQHPVVLAEDLATLDIVTGGRLTIGLGAGYRETEFTALGIPFSERFRRLEESVEVMRHLWTEERVTFDGSFFHLDAVEPHLQPIQQPHPPIWLGAMGEAGIRRSARLADAWPITPEARVHDIKRKLAIYEDEREKAGLPHVKHPLRRELVPARNKDLALTRFEGMAKKRLIEYARRSLTVRDEHDLDEGFREIAEQEAFLGSPEEIVAQVASIAAVAPIDQIIVRAHWPGMDTEAVTRYLDDLGEAVIPAVRSIESVDRVDRS
jgi:alkanesulfonate monooxygenase SsuD/methylene tetrahydromethanopterin reductase-like flavin-dependent oxidoreductase (luciferase family)